MYDLQFLKEPHGKLGAETDYSRQTRLAVRSFQATQFRLS